MSGQGDPRPTVLLHIGTHKTGSTSIQRFMLHHAARLAAAGVLFPRGAYLPSNHVELHSAAIRPDRPTPFKLDKGLVVDDAYVATVARDVAAVLAQATARWVLYSAEGLSFLRHADELDRLRALFPDHRVEIVVYLRDPEAYRLSHLGELERRRGRGGIVAGDFADLEPGSWLTRYRERLAPFRATFGSEHVHVIDYDVEVARDGSAIPVLLRILGVADQFTAEDWSAFGYNRTPPAPAAGQPLAIDNSER